MNEHANKIQHLAQCIERCLKEEGLDPELEVSDEGALVAARVQGKGGVTLRVVAHITDRQFTSANHGFLSVEQARARGLDVVSRPSLEHRSHSGQADQTS